VPDFPCKVAGLYLAVCRVLEDINLNSQPTTNALSRRNAASSQASVISRLADVRKRALGLLVIPSMFCLVQCSTPAIDRPAAPYVFSQATCTVGANRGDYADDPSSVDLSFEKRDTVPFARAMNGYRLISGECVASIQSANRSILFFPEGPFKALANGNYVPTGWPSEPEDYLDAPMALKRLPGERMIFSRVKSNVATSIWRHKSGAYKVRLTTDPSLSPSLQAVILTSRLPLRSATFFLGIHGEGGQVMLLQEQRDGTLKWIAVDVMIRELSG
jgi:hypothetical protein